MGGSTAGVNGTSSDCGSFAAGSSYGDPSSLTIVFSPSSPKYIKPVGLESLLAIPTYGGLSPIASRVYTGGASVCVSDNPAATIVLPCIALVPASSCAIISALFVIGSLSKFVITFG